MRLIALILMALATAWAGEPRKSAQEYPAHFESPAVDIGADYMVHSYSDEGQMYFTKDYLVLDVAIYPKAPLELTGGSFELRINNSKHPLQQASAEFVAASMKYPDWVDRPHAEVGASAGDAGVVLGAPPAVGRFPGDPTGVSRYPKPPRAPEDPHKVEKTAKDAGQIAVDNSLKAGKVTAPVAGNIYFEYAGNMKKVKTLTLIFHTASGDKEIPIR
jgi:hypothetical protein